MIESKKGESPFRLTEGKLSFFQTGFNIFLDLIVVFRHLATNNIHAIIIGTTDNATLEFCMGR